MLLPPQAVLIVTRMRNLVVLLIVAIAVVALPAVSANVSRREQLKNCAMCEFLTKPVFESVATSQSEMTVDIMTQCRTIGIPEAIVRQIMPLESSNPNFLVSLPSPSVILLTSLLSSVLKLFYSLERP